MAFKLTKHETTVAEVYLLSLAVTAYGIYSSGEHRLKKVAVAAVIAVFTPVFVALKAKAKSWLAVRALTKATKASTPKPLSPAPVIDYAALADEVSKVLLARQMAQVPPATGV